MGQVVTLTQQQISSPSSTRGKMDPQSILRKPIFSSCLWPWVSVQFNSVTPSGHGIRHSRHTHTKTNGFNQMNQATMMPLASKHWPRVSQQLVLPSEHFSRDLCSASGGGNVLCSQTFLLLSELEWRWMTAGLSFWSEDSFMEWHVEDTQFFAPSISVRSHQLSLRDLLEVSHKFALLLASLCHSR